MILRTKFCYSLRFVTLPLTPLCFPCEARKANPFVFLFEQSKGCKGKDLLKVLLGKQRDLLKLCYFLETQKALFGKGFVKIAICLPQKANVKC